MTEKTLSLTRRKFMVLGSAAIATPALGRMAGMVPEARAAEKTYDFTDKKSCDLVVLGGGGSGLVAAVRAAQLTGKKVIVLEKAAFTGGGALGASTVRTFGSKWQAKRNLPDTTAAYARAMMDDVYWRLDAKLISNCLLGTGRFFDWLCEQGDDIEDQFKPGKYVFAEIDSEPIGPQMSRQIGSKMGFGVFVTSKMVEKCKTHGIEILTNHPVVDIEVKNGKIIAAIAKSDKGFVRVACEACILATGSWINNEAILKKYEPEFAAIKESMGPSSQSGHMNSNYTGDGIALAEKVGAFVDYDSFCLRLMGPMSMPRSQVFSAMIQTPFIITVNLKGKRFCSEPVQHMGIFDGGHVQIDQPGAESYDIFDQNTIAAALEYQKCIEANNCDDERSAMVPDGSASVFPETMEEIRNDLKNNSDDIIKADTLEELADKISVDKKNFLETLKKYNESCEKGADMEYFKEKDYLVPINKPPYYASKSGLGTDGAFGGVRVNPEMQAYKADRKSLVEGLYVTGDFASGRHINLGGVKMQVLNDLSWAFSSGFLAGTNAAKYLESLG